MSYRKSYQDLSRLISCFDCMPCSMTPEVSHIPALLPVYGILLSNVAKFSATSNIRFVTELNHFSPVAYGLQYPCLRLTCIVTNTSPRLGMECAGSALLQSHFQRLATSHFVTQRSENQYGSAHHPARNVDGALRAVYLDHSSMLPRAKHTLYLNQALEGYSAAI